jgi:dipeptidyl aminopeptidase/acylaminoacyl peptidase
LATQQLTNLSTAIPWDVEGLSLNDQGSTLAFSTNEGGFSKLYLLDTQTKKYRPVPNLPPGVTGSFGFAPDGKRLAISMNTSTTPSDVFVVNTATDAIERWTFSETGGLNTANFVEPKLIQYPTFDSLNGKPRQIPAFVYIPKKVQGKVPVVISIHGGPEGQSLPSFNPTIQYMVNELGVAVLVPNVRGSSGYGKTYLQLDNGFLRENSVKDIGTLLDWIGRQPNLDAGKVSVFGGSYGGYMVLASMTMFNDRLRAGIDLFGISNWLTFLKNTSEYRRDLRRVEYGDEREPKMNEFLARISPIQKVNNITKPMFIFQGVNDPRVPVTESEQMLAALKKNGTPTWYVQAKDEGHGIAKKANRDYTYAAIMLFLENYLLKEKVKIDTSR